MAPYRIDIPSAPPDALDTLIQLGALDVDRVDGALAAIIPDWVTPEAVSAALGVADVSVSPAIARDNGSVWLVNPRPVRIGNFELQLTDSRAFGTGHHPTTALCIQALEEALSITIPDAVLDVGTGSGVLALAALIMGVPRAVGLDIDADALKIAAENARVNHLSDRLTLLRGRPGVVSGVWELVIANILAAPLIDMAPELVQRVARRGHLILSGIPSSLEAEVRRAYEHLGMRYIRSNTRGGWTALVFQASW
ncbi:MAG TPA: 50S ribosomal protein L11 methyltransferase [Terriglobia bacterium]|nr:50S ribosomal protein L11 methyltransferase [Terriglobia bacterium]